MNMLVGDPESTLKRGPDDAVARVLLEPTPKRGMREDAMDDMGWTRAPSPHEQSRGIAQGEACRDPPLQALVRFWFPPAGAHNTALLHLCEPIVQPEGWRRPCPGDYRDRPCTCRRRRSEQSKAQSGVTVAGRCRHAPSHAKR